MSRYLADSIHLSNKACRHCYTRPKDPRGCCGCPKGRCWYSEQTNRRADRLRALSPGAWTAEVWNPDLNDEEKT